MRRSLAFATFAVVMLAACGTDEDAVPVSLPPVEGDRPTDSADPDCIPVGGDVPEPDLGDIEPPPTSPDKPEVEIPAELPTELERTVLAEGIGEGAEAGDTVIVDYIGVRSSDGIPFDNSYDRGQPFPVVLGQGSVIQGWDDGLLESTTGERIQLDIPSAQAYGEVARDNIICANEDLTFVIDVHAVVKPTTADDAPEGPGVELAPDGVDDTIFEDLVVGDGPAIELGETAVIRYANFRGDDGELIETNWGGDVQQVPYEANLLPGLLDGMEGMNVGGQRAITVPPEDGFPENGGLPDDVPMIFVIDLVGTY